MIPKLLHFIWVGKSQMPTESISFIEKWKVMYPDYTIKIWDDAAMLEHDIIPPEYIQYVEDIRFSPAFKADIARYIIINKYGGIYIDIDFEPLKRIPAKVFRAFDFFGTVQNNNEVSIGLFAAKPNTDILIHTIKNIHPSIERAKKGNYFINDALFKMTGPEFFSKQYSQFSDNPKYMCWEPKYFYPYWHTEKHRRDENFSITSPDAFAVHHWFATHKTYKPNAPNK
jgi:mannosyltransferase OCH1-like enzyme